MPPLRQTVREMLAADATLAGLLTGGWFDADTLPRDGGGVDIAPRQSDGVRIKPYGIVRWRQSISYQPETILLSAERETFELYFYQHKGYDIIEQAISRAKALLHNAYLTATDRAIAHVLYTFSSAEIPSEANGGAASRFSRYQVIDIRK